MGLDCSHGAWRGSYIAFHQWRTEIARLCGIPLDFMESFYDPNPNARSGIMLLLRVAEHDEQRLMVVQGYPKRADDDTHIASVRMMLAAFPLKWESLRPDPIHYLLCHSDSKGYLTPSECRKVAARLEELLPLLPEKPASGHIGDWRVTTQKFIDGCRAAAAAKERLRFS